jgi:hypothetical protein
MSPISSQLLFKLTTRSILFIRWPYFIHFLKFRLIHLRPLNFAQFVWNALEIEIRHLIPALKLVQIKKAGHLLEQLRYPSLWSFYRHVDQYRQYQRLDEIRWVNSLLQMNLDECFHHQSNQVCEFIIAWRQTTLINLSLKPLVIKEGKNLLWANLVKLVKTHVRLFVHGRNLGDYVNC